MTPGNYSEMSSLRCEHAGALAVLLVLYAFQLYLGQDTVQSVDVVIWLDNAEVLRRAQRSIRGKKIKDALVLDYDLWAEMEDLQRRLTFNIHWEKVDSHIHTRTYAPGVKPKGDKYSIRLNEFVDGLAGNIREEATLHPTIHPRQEFFYTHSQVMVRTTEDSFIYGQVRQVVTEGILGDVMIKYLLGKNKQWTEEIFNLVDWDRVGAYMNSLNATRATNVVKFVHDWQQDGHQIGLFYGGGDNTLCPTGCGAAEIRHHFISCKAPQAKQSFRKRLDVLKGVHKRQRTASAISTAFYNIINHLHHQSMSPHPFLLQFDSTFDNTLLAAWKEQESIGWGQVMKGRLSKKWGEAQHIYYQMNPDTKREKRFNQKTWTKATIKSFIDMSLGMWDDRCKVLHGRTVDEKRKIKKEKILGKARQCFDQQDRVMEQDMYMFDGGWESLETRGALYLEKWVASYEVAASQKIQLERQLERQRGKGVVITTSDHPASRAATSYGQSRATNNQATYGPDG